MAETYTEKINSEEFFLPEYGHRYLPADCADDFSDEGSTGAGVAKYFQRIGLHALLSRKDEVKIAKRIETAEHQILRMLLQTSIAVEHIVDLGTKIKAGELKAKRVSRALRTGDTCNDGAAQIVKFLETITRIEAMNAKNNVHREKLLSASIPARSSIFTGALSGKRTEFMNFCISGISSPKSLTSWKQQFARMKIYWETMPG